MNNNNNKKQIIPRVFTFSPNAKSPAPNILKGKTVEQWLKEHYVQGCNFRSYLLQRSGVYHYLGWEYDFTPWMKRFIVKQHREWSEYYAPNKTALRKSIYDRIDEIVEIPKDLR